MSDVRVILIAAAVCLAPPSPQGGTPHSTE